MKLQIFESFLKSKTDSAIDSPITMQKSIFLIIKNFQRQLTTGCRNILLGSIEAALRRLTSKLSNSTNSLCELLPSK